MKTFKKLQQEFQEALGDLELGHGMTWTDKNFEPNHEIKLIWNDRNVLFYHIAVYLKSDGMIAITYGYPNGDGGTKFFGPGKYDEVKDFILNYFDNTEREKD